MSNGKWMPPGYKVRVAFVLPDHKTLFLQLTISRSDLETSLSSDGEKSRRILDSPLQHLI